MKCKVYVRVQRVYSYECEVPVPEDALELANQARLGAMELTTDDEENREEFDLRDAAVEDAVVCSECGEEVHRGQVRCACHEDGAIYDPLCEHKYTKDYGEGPVCLVCGSPDIDGDD